MGAPVAVFSGTVFPEAAPTAAVHAFHACAVVRLPWRGPKPAVVVKILRNRLRCVLRGGRKLTELANDGVHLADVAVEHQLGGLAKRSVRSLLGTDLDDASIALGCAAHRLAFIDG